MASLRLLGLAATASAHPLVLLQQHAEVSFGHEEGVHQVTMQKEATLGQNEAEASWDIKSWFGFGKADVSKASVAKQSVTQNTTATVKATGAKNSVAKNDTVGKATVAKHTITNGTLASKASASCGYWCSDHIFVRKEANKTLMKNVSSWAEKCTWSHCSGCSHCDGLPTLGLEAHDVEEDNGTEWKGPASCEKWCKDGKFRTMGPNITMMMDVAWDAKCTWHHCGACPKCDGIAEGDVNLIMESEVGSLGDSVPTTEAGYQEVAKLKSDDEMKAFIRRLIAEDEKYVGDEGALSGVVPFYSGSMDVQDIERLRTELRSAAWILQGEGAVAPLTAMGYDSVKKMMSRGDMVEFARRMLDVEQNWAESAALAEMASNHHGLDFEDLKLILRCAPWVISRDGEAALCP